MIDTERGWTCPNCEDRVANCHGIRICSSCEWVESV